MPLDHKRRGVLLEKQKKGGELIEVAEVLDKIFPCMGCKKDIKLKRNDANDGWIRFEMDGHTIHDCPAKKQQQQQKLKGAPATAAGVSQLESKIDTLISEVQALRKELQQQKQHHSV